MSLNTADLTKYMQQWQEMDPSAFASTGTDHGWSLGWDLNGGMGAWVLKSSEELEEQLSRLPHGDTNEQRNKNLETVGATWVEHWSMHPMTRMMGAERFPEEARRIYGDDWERVVEEMEHTPKAKL